MRPLLLCCLIATVAHAQVRDVATAAVGTATVAGRVLMAGEAPTPVRRAIVTITGGALPAGLSVVTNDDGEFVFERMPAGRYAIAATKAAHLRASWGASQPGRTGVPLALADGERRADLSIYMAKAAVVAGTLKTADGSPLGGVDVGVFRVASPTNAQALEPAGDTITDDRGMYRVFDLTPGDYVVAARPHARLSGPGDAAVWTSEQLDHVLKDATRSVTPPDTRAGWAPVYFPGVASPQEAVVVRLRAGDERTGLDFSASMMRLGTIEVLVSGDTAVLPSARIFFNAVGRRLEPLVAVTPRMTSQMTSGGRLLTYTGVPPGMYTIMAHVAESPTSQAQWARVDVSMSEGSTPRLAMTLQPTFTVSGRLNFQELTEPPADVLKGATVRLAPANGMGQSASGGTLMGNPIIRPASIDAAGEFHITGVVPGEFTLAVTVPNGKPWTAASAMYGTRDWLDSPQHVTAAIGGVMVAMNERPTRLEGRLVTQAGEPGASLFMAVFPQDQTMWTAISRRIVSTRAGTDGHWALDALPPGDYYVVALSDLAPEELVLTEFLAQLVPIAVKVSLAPGERKTQDLQIQRHP